MNLQIAVNENRDIFLDGKGNLALVRDVFAVEESAQEAAQSQLGEMQYAIDRGIPNFKVVWNGAPSIAQFEAALRRELLRVTDVIGVPSISAKFVGDALVYTATIQTTYGLRTLTNG
jgi:hypothetical protein